MFSKHTGWSFLFIILLLSHSYNGEAGEKTAGSSQTASALPSGLAGTRLPTDISRRLRNVGIGSVYDLKKIPLRRLATQLGITLPAAKQLVNTAWNGYLASDSDCLRADQIDWNYYPPGASEPPIDLASEIPPQLPWIVQENNGQEAVDERWYPDPAKGWVILAYNLGRPQGTAREDYGYVLAYNRVSGLARFFLWTYAPEPFSKVAVHFELMDVSQSLVDQPVYAEGRLFPNSQDVDDWNDATVVFTGVETNSWQRAEIPLIYDESIYQAGIPLGFRMTLIGIDEEEIVLEMAGITAGDIQGTVTKTTYPALDTMALGASGLKALVKRTPADIASFAGEAANAFYSMMFGEPEIETSQLQAALHGTFFGTADGEGITIYPQTHFWFLLPDTYEEDSVDAALLAETERAQCDVRLGAYGFADGEPRPYVEATLPSPAEGEIILPDDEDGDPQKPLRLPIPDNLPACDEVLDIQMIRTPAIIVSPDAPAVVSLDPDPLAIIHFAGYEEDFTPETAVGTVAGSSLEEVLVGNHAATTFYQFEVNPTINCPECFVQQTFLIHSRAHVTYQECH